MPRRVAGATAKGASDRYVIEAADRALILLELLAFNPDLGVAEIARMMEVSKTLAFRLLHTLEKRGYVVRDEERRTSSLGYRVLNLASNVNRQNLLITTTKSVMDELAKLCDEDVNLFTRIGLNSVCIAARSSVHQVRVFPEVGLRMAMHAGAASPLLLAYAPEDVQEAVLSGPLEAFTPNTVTDPAKLRQRLRRMRKQGFHISRGDVDLAAFAIAAPIFGRDQPADAGDHRTPQAYGDGLRGENVRPSRQSRPSNGAFLGCLTWDGPPGPHRDCGDFHSHRAIDDRH